jgi:predicted DCC family thiol-disulfide oxidoreductase YuxK
MSGIILFDGVCNFCNRTVQFIIKRDKQGLFKFASLQSEIGKELLKKHGIDQNIDSFILIVHERYYMKSTAALHVCKKLKGAWKLFYLFKIVPTPLRDIVYDHIAKNRYKWFGKREACVVPSKEIKNRFLD